MNRDAVVVPFYEAEDYISPSISITGMVNKPGTYFINDETRLLDVINKAGGYKSGAYTFGGVLNRASAKELQESFNMRVYRDTVDEIFSGIASGKQIDNSTLDLLMEEFKSSTITGRVITEFDEGLIRNNPSKNVRLFDGDEIFIPEIKNEVYMFGSYFEPSVVPYDPAFNIKDYLKLVGGKRESAAKNFVVIDPNGSSHYYRDIFYSPLQSQPTIYPGSIIYLPKDIGRIDGVEYVSVVAPILSSLSIALASLNSIVDN